MLSTFPIFNPLEVSSRYRCAIWNTCNSVTDVHTRRRHFIQMYRTEAMEQQQQQHTLNNINTTTNLLLHRRRSPHSTLHMLECENDDSFDDGVVVDLLPDVTHQLKSKRWWNGLPMAYLLEFEPVGSCNGLLCLTDCDGEPVIVLNPVNGDYKILPKIPHPRQPLVYGFGFDEVANVYKVIVVSSVLGDDCFYRFKAQVHTLGSGEWRMLRDVPYKTPVTTTRFFTDYFKTEQVFANGALHWLLVLDCNNDTFEHILAFHLGREEFQIIPLPPGLTQSKLPHSRLAQTDLPPKWLWGFGGNLCVVHESDDECDMWVMKDYGAKGFWTKDHVIPRDGPGFSGASLHPVTLTKNGNILLNVNGESLFYYDLLRKRFSPLTIREGVLPKFDLVFTHVPSIKSVGDIVGIQSRAQ